MVDNRFFPLKDQPTLEALASSCVADLECDFALADLSQHVVGAGTVPFLSDGELGFVGDKAYVDGLQTLQSGIVIVTKDLVQHCNDTVQIVVSPNPYKAFTALVGVLYADALHRQYAGLLSWQDASDQGLITIGADCDIAANVMVGPDVEIGDHVSIGPNTVLGRGVTIGRGSRIADNVSIYCAHLGDDNLIHSGVRIGADGFGFIPTETGPKKIPQLGRVLVQDGVEIGTNTSIDRGTLDDTVIGEQTKIDNLVQIAHNSVIGRFCQLSGHVGLAGSVVLGDGVLLAGRAGISNKVKVGDKAVVYACSLVTKDVPAGGMVGGSPATDIKMWRKEVAAIRRLARSKK